MDDGRCSLHGVDDGWLMYCCVTMHGFIWCMGMSGKCIEVAGVVVCGVWN